MTFVYIGNSTSPRPAATAKKTMKEPDVPADGRRVDAQPRPLVSASAKEERRDPDDEHGEGREHQRCPEYRSYANRGPFFRCFTCEDGLEDGDYGDHALRQGGAHGGEEASHGPLAHPEASSQYLDRVRKEGSPQKDRSQRRHELYSRQHIPSPLGRAAKHVKASHRGLFACRWSRSVRLGAGDRPGASLRIDDRSPRKSGWLLPNFH